MTARGDVVNVQFSIAEKIPWTISDHGGVS
jgi:hypothetical protein